MKCGSRAQHNDELIGGNVYSPFLAHFLSMGCSLQLLQRCWFHILWNHALDRLLVLMRTNDSRIQCWTSWVSQSMLNWFELLCWRVVFHMSHECFQNHTCGARNFQCIPISHLHLRFFAQTRCVITHVGIFIHMHGHGMLSMHLTNLSSRNYRWQVWMLSWCTLVMFIEAGELCLLSIYESVIVLSRYHGLFQSVLIPIWLCLLWVFGVLHCDVPLWVLTCTNTRNFCLVLEVISISCVWTSNFEVSAMYCNNESFDVVPVQRHEYPSCCSCSWYLQNDTQKTHGAT